MRHNSTSGLGALHPILFFIFVYGISLVLALFVCRSIYHSINGDVSARPNSLTLTESNSTAFR